MYFIKKSNPKDKIHYHSNILLQQLLLLMGIFIAVAVFYTVSHKPESTQIDVFLILFSVITVILLFLEKVSYTPFFLLSTFTFITSWRLVDLAGYSLVGYLCLFTFILIFLQFVLTIKNDLLNKEYVNSRNLSSAFEWQLLFIRMYIGYDMIPHFCEKLFAGTAIRQVDVITFATQFHLPHALFFVILGGLMEIGGALSLACGLFTRVGSICLATYLIVCSILGGHFSDGFVWANQGGGWEYPILWTVLVLSFAWTGANTFSIDEILNEKFRLPTFIKILMGIRKNENKG